MTAAVSVSASALPSAWNFLMSFSFSVGSGMAAGPGPADKKRSHQPAVPVSPFESANAAGLRLCPSERSVKPAVVLLTPITM
jgi:hypothetical protein